MIGWVPLDFDNLRDLYVLRRIFKVFLMVLWSFNVEIIASPRATTISLKAYCAERSGFEKWTAHLILL